MKRIISFLIVTLVITVALIYYYPTLVRYFSVHIDEVTSFSFSYTTGLIKDTTVLYTAVCEDNGECNAKVKLRGIADEDAVEVAVDKNFMRKIRNILEDNEVSKWNNYYETNTHALNGDEFTLKVEMANGDKITAYGYMKWPNNYGTVKTEFDNLFKDLVY